MDTWHPHFQSQSLGYRLLRISAKIGLLLLRSARLQWLMHMCHVDVYLSDGDAAFSATLFLLDAEKLIQCSTGDLKTSDEKNVSLMKIDLAIRNKEVLCFLKCLDMTFQGNNVRTYPVLKMYLKSELTCGERENTASVGASEARTSSAIAALKGDGTKEFFTPTIKNMLDEIHVAPDEATHFGAINCSEEATKLLLILKAIQALQLLKKESLDYQE